MNIVVLDGYTLNPGDNPWHDLEQLGQVTVYDRSAESEILPRAVDADVLVVNKVRLTVDRLQQLPRLRLIAVTATGFDCVDTQAARERSIAVSNVPVYGTNSVAQFVIAMLLELCHHVAQHDEAVRDGGWQERGDFSFCVTPQVELFGKTLGIVGFGRIGRRVGQLGNALGMNVLATTRTPVESPGYDGFALVELEELVARSDVISLHCPLTEATAGMVDKAFLSRCKQSALLINASRGALVVEADLAQALRDGNLAGAAVDVVMAEPIETGNPLLQAPNCIITPHMAWATLEARRRLMQATVQNIAAFQYGTPQHVVN